MPGWFLLWQEAHTRFRFRLQEQPPGHVTRESARQGGYQSNNPRNLPPEIDTSSQPTLLALGRENKHCFTPTELDHGASTQL
ncbi:hypothetical protein V495_03550 [Pseudogymnoascus sp. VKM F-4514 (FW-929)]|nr:hypothetical protein V490_06373 [Pseudogymnoascus sp. VKM F-3557]KFY44249.1 hypothetical protein V495_03550 [Pseudogymnoascus sp. VKM F-4514 (FW-929)]